MVISGSGPNLDTELEGSQALAGFPDPDLFDRCAHSGRRLLTLPVAPALVQSPLRDTTCISHEATLSFFASVCISFQWVVLVMSWFVLIVFH